MGLSEKECNQVVCGSMLHDLGKIGIPVEILEYPGKLSPQAMNIMRTHVDITEKIFGDVIEGDGQISCPSVITKSSTAPVIREA